jgi:hypothetical protein
MSAFLMLPQFEEVLYQQQHRLDLNWVLGHGVGLASEGDLLVGVGVVMDE